MDFGNVRLISMETGNESGYFCVVAYVLRSISKSVCNRSSISLDGGRASVLLSEEEAHEVADFYYRGSPEVHLCFRYTIIGTLTILMHIWLK